MVGVEQYITNYVYLNKEISLEGLGTITLNDAIPDGSLTKKELTPVANLEFLNKPSVQTTPDFVTYYSEMRGKIMPIAENDIHAFLSTTIQLLNIGNPVEFKGLGTISKQKNGSLMMTPGYFVPLLNEQAQARRIKERLSEQPAEFNEYHKKERARRTGVNWLVYLLLGLLIAALAFAAYWFILKSEPTATETDASANAGDTVIPIESTTPLNLDSLRADSTGGMNIFAPIADSNLVVSWKAFFRDETNKATALQAMSRYSSTQSPVQMETRDSVTFRFFVPVESNIRDTSYKRDSIRRFFARPVTLERMN